MKAKIFALTAAAAVTAFGSAAMADPVLSSNISDARALHAAGFVKPLESATLRDGSEVKSVNQGERMFIVSDAPAVNENFVSSNQQVAVEIPGSGVHTVSSTLEDVQDAQTGAYEVGRDDKINLGG